MTASDAIKALGDAGIDADWSDSGKGKVGALPDGDAFADAYAALSKSDWAELDPEGVAMTYERVFYRFLADGVELEMTADFDAGDYTISVKEGE